MAGRTDARGAARSAGWRRAAAGTVALALILGLVGALVGVRRSAVHHAEAVVLVTPLEGNPFSPNNQGDELVNLNSEAQLVRSDEVAARVASLSGTGLDGEDLLADLDVTVPDNTQILRIGFDAADPDTAAALAQGFAREYLLYRRDRAQGLVDGRRTSIRAEIDSQNGDIADLSAQLDDATSASERAVLSGQLSAISQQVSDLRTQLAESSVGSLDPGQVVTPASASAASGSDALPWLGAVAGALLGLVAGVALAVTRSRTTRRLRRPSDVADVGLPVLAEVSGADLDEGPGAAGVRDLRSAVLGRVDADSLTLLVAPATGAGGPRTAAGLAAASAASAVTTILVEAGPSSSYTGATTDRPGLVDVLRGEVALHDVLVARGEHLDVLPAGRGAAELDDLVVSPAMRRILRECGKRAELVVVSGGSPTTPAGRALVDMVEALLVEVPAGRLTIDDASDVLDVAEERGLSWSGAVWLTGRLPQLDLSAAGPVSVDRG